MLKRERRWMYFIQNRLLSFFYIKENMDDKQQIFSLELIREVNKMKKNKVDLMLDSGAFSAWSKQVEIDIDEYIAFCLQHVDIVSYIVNLDVIPGKFGQKNLPREEVERSARKGYENYEYMLSKGIPKSKLIHVFHQNEDFKWLQKMVKEIEYIGISPANDRTTSEKILWLDKCMKYALDEKGMPLVKFHGFAVTSLQLLMRYPFYSVDSTSWVMTGRLGSIYVPRYRNGKWIYDENSWKIAVSSKSPANKEAGKHFSTLSPKHQQVVLDYIHDKGYVMGVSSFESVPQTTELKPNQKWSQKKPTSKTALRELETITEPGLANTYQLRDEINIIYFMDLEKDLPKWPWAYKRTSSAGFGL